MNLAFQRADKKAPNTANTPPTIGKYREKFMARPSKKVPASKAKLTPKQSPGKRVGSKTPNDIPTRDDMIARTHKTTTARFNPTGKKRGSRKT
mmetsp:Transcript_22197/g.45043  ORF Transcript_22197/g.45043 Transcript_22197/m.45043 type:complete len:93 (-) Transcript_22197:268-546(-)